MTFSHKHLNTMEFLKGYRGEKNNDSQGGIFKSAAKNLRLKSI